MKLQGLSVFFCLIAVPIILVMTYYVQAQVNTIALQMSYDTKLLDATHDSMVALEINTANENLSAVSDSLRSIVKASTNIFINSLATNLGMSNATKSALQPYVPAMLFTLYDGYYIYSPTRVPVICTDEHGVAVYVGDEGVTASGDRYVYNPESTDVSEVNVEDYGMLLYKIEGVDEYVTDINTPNVEFKIDYILKSYTPYAARYKTATKDIQVNYTLDNFINVYGDINGVYYTKSGYYTNIDVTSCTSPAGDIRNYGDEEIEKFCDNRDNQIEITVKIDGTDYVIKTTDTYQIDPDTGLPEIDSETGEKKILGSSQAREAIKYYLKTNAFSDWVRSSLSDIEECDIEERISNELYELTIDGKEVFKQGFFRQDTNERFDTEFFVKFNDDTPDDGVDNNKHGKIFDSAQDPESDTSVFMNHKHNVMKNSMQYNLNLAMSSYNQMNLSSYSFYMPIVDEETWGRVTSRISVLTFMQGWNCGLKTYNNYACVSSTNNEFTVIPEEIYYVGTEVIDTIYNVDKTLIGNDKKYFENLDGIPEDSDPLNLDYLNDYNVKKYHRIDCPILKDELNTLGIDNVSDIRTFVSKEIKYDKVYDRVKEGYIYDHKYMACYKCIVSRNYMTNKPGGEASEMGYYGFNYSTLSDAAKKAYVIALGKEREELYKTNQIVNNQGVSIDLPGVNSSNAGDGSSTFNINLVDSTKKLQDIDSIEITISDVKSNVAGEVAYYRPVAYAQISINDTLVVPNNDEADKYYRIINQMSKQTIKIDFKNNSSLLNNSGTLSTIKIDVFENIIDNGDGSFSVSDPAITMEYMLDTVKINYKS